MGRDLHRRGFDVLLFDLRGHGQSDPSRLYLGRRERSGHPGRDELGSGRGFTNDRIGWLGYSMGGSTVLMEAARNPAIQVAVIDSPYGDLAQAAQDTAQQAQRPAGWFNPGILLAARMDLRRAHRRPGADPVRPFMGRAPAPGDPWRIRHDGAGRARLTQLASAVGASCLTMTLPGVDHVQAYESDPEVRPRRRHRSFSDHLSP